MSKPTSIRVLLTYTLSQLRLRVFLAVLTLLVLTPVLATVYSITRGDAPHAYAANPTTLNFQARLLNSSGSLVPDGIYNVEFKLYNASTSSGSSQGSCTGDANCLWTETRLTSDPSNQQIEVKNGYLSAYLGDKTALPTNIWNQQLYLTMNIGGTSGPTWDGEMTPRIRLTSVPFAFRATAADSAETLSKNTGSFTGTVDFSTMTADRKFLFPDTSLATTASPGTICVYNGATSNCPAATGSAYYIHNDTGLQTAANFNIQASDSGVNGTVAGVFRGAAAGQTVDLVEYQATNGTVLASVTAGGNLKVAASVDTYNAGTLSLGTATATAVSVGKAGITTTVNGALTVSQAGTFSSTVGITGLATLSGGLSVTNGGNVSFQKGGDYSTVGSQNDVDFGTGALFRLTGLSAQTITGIANGTDGRRITLVNAGSAAATLVNLSGLSVGSNQITTGTGGNLTIPVGASIELVYDSSSTVWRVTGGSATSGGGANQQLSNLSGTIAVNADLNPDADGTRDLGSSAFSWRTLYADTSVLTPKVDTVSAITLNIGTVTANAISIAKAGVTTTVNGALTATELLTGNAGITTSGGAVSLTGNAASSLTTSAGALTLTSAAATTWSTSAGDLTIQAGSGIVSLGTSTSLTASGTLAITSGGATAFSIDAGGAASLSVGATNANAVSISRTGVTTTVNGSLTVTQAGQFNGGLTAASDFTVTNAGNVAFQRNTSDFTAVGTQNDVNFGTGALFRLNGASAQTITSIQGGVDGRVITIINAGANAATIQNDSGGTATNRIITGTGGNVSVPTGASIALAYDSAASRWRMVGSSAAGGGAGVNTVGTFTGASIANGASISGTTITFGAADDTTNPGLVTTGSQTFGGAKTFSSLIQGNAGITTSGGAVSLTGNAASSLTTSAGALTLTSATAATWSTSAGDLTIQAGSGTVSLGTSTNLTATGALAFTSGGANTLSVDAGGAAALNLGTTNANAVSISRTGVTTTVNGALTVTQATILNGTTALNDNVTVAAGKTIRFVGDTTVNRPVSPGEGTLFFNTTTKRLEIFADGRWQTDRSSVTAVVAASDSPDSVKEAADYVASGTADQNTINAALTAAAGGKVYLAEGTYTVSGSITVPNNTTLVGAGKGTLITIPGSFNAAINAITNSDTTTGTGIVIQDLRLDGNRSAQTSGAMYGIYLDGISAGTGANTTHGVKVTGVAVNNWFSYGYYLNTVSDSVFTSNVAHGNGDYGFILDTGSNNTFTGNTSEGNDATGFYLNNVTTSIFEGNISSGAVYGGGFSINSVSKSTFINNIVSGNNSGGLDLYLSTDNTISSNNISNNGGTTTNGAFWLGDSDNNSIINNTITDTSCTTTCYAIQISDAASTGNYLVGNTLGGGSISDIGTGTIYGGQLNSSGNYMLQPTGTIELMKNTNITGDLVTTGLGTFFGDITATTSTATNDSLVLSVSTGGSNGYYGTITNADLTAVRVWTLPDADGTFCLSTGNCNNVGGYVQFAPGSAQADSSANASIYINDTAGGNLLQLQSGAADKFVVDNSGNTTISGNVIVAASKSLTLTGGNTASRPASPTEGMLYYDTDTKQLLIYANGKWQADRNEAVLVAASNSSDADKASADYITDGTNDQVEINAALTAASASGTRKTGKVYLFAGTYTAGATILIPNNTTLAGAGQGAIIKLADIDATDNLIENSDTSTGTGIVIRDVKLQGQKAVQTGAITQHGIYLNGVGGGTGCTVGTLFGADVSHVVVEDFETSGLYLNNTSNSVVTSSSFLVNGATGFSAVGCLASINAINGNVAQGNGTDGFYMNAGFSNVLSGNVSYNNSNAGFSIDNASNSNNLVNNNTRGNNTYGIYIRSSQFNVLSNNTVRGGSTYGIYLVNNGASGSNNNSISNNDVYDVGGSTTNNAIYLVSSDQNNITGNVINDSSASTNNYAINVSDTGSDANYLADNLLNSGTVNDLSDATGGFTIYGGQATGSTFAIQPSSSVTITGNAASTISTTSGNLTLQAGSGTVTLGSSTALTATGALSITSGGANALSLDAGGAAAVNIGGTSATSIILGRAGGGTIRVGQNGGTVQIDGTNFDVSTAGVITVAGGQTADITTQTNQNLTVEANGTGVIVLNDSTTANGTLTFSGVTTDITTGTNEDLTVVANGTGVINLNDSITAGGNITFATGANRTLSVAANSSNAAGYNLTLSAGAAGTGASAFTGGTLTLQGGAAGGTGNANGGAVTIAGGAGTGTGVMGLVGLSPTAFTSVGSTQSFGTTSTLGVTYIDNYGTVPMAATTSGLTITIPAPTNATIGRIVYIANVGATYDFNILLSGTSISIALKPNTTATLIWNGNGWTAAGASSSTDLQAAYNNTLTSAGGAELVLNPTGGAADGLTIRNNGTTPIVGGLLEVQSSIGTNLFSVNNYATEYASDGGVETAATFTTNWLAAPGGGTVTRESTTSSFIATGQASAKVVTAGANQGLRNKLSAALTSTKVYQVSFTAKLSTGSMTTLDVVYSDNGTTATSATCATGQSVASTTWSKVTCTFTATGTITTNNAIIVRQSDATGRTLYIDNMSVTEISTTTTPSNVQIGGGLLGGQPTLFTLDRFSSAPVANGNTTYYGSMYYDTTTGRIQCYEADGWGACGSAPDNIITLTPEYTGAVLNGNGIGTMTADFCGNGGGLSVNTGFCASGEARNYYRWTSPQATAQTYSIYVNYKLPTTFKNFYDDNTIKLTAFKDHATNAGATLDVYRKNVVSGTITQCGSNTAITTGTSAWNQTSLGGSGETGCGFVAGDYVIFKITVTSQSSANVYIENLDFTFSNT